MIVLAIILMLLTRKCQGLEMSVHFEEVGITGFSNGEPSDILAHGRNPKEKERTGNSLPPQMTGKGPHLLPGSCMPLLH